MWMVSSCACPGMKRTPRTLVSCFVPLPATATDGDCTATPSCPDALGDVTVFPYPGDSGSSPLAAAAADAGGNVEGAALVVLAVLVSCSPSRMPTESAGRTPVPGSADAGVSEATAAAMLRASVASGTVVRCSWPLRGEAVVYVVAASVSVAPVSARPSLLRLWVTSAYVGSREKRWKIMSASVCSACRLNSSLRRISKQMRKHDCCVDGVRRIEFKKRGGQKKIRVMGGGEERRGKTAV